MSEEMTSPLGGTTEAAPEGGATETVDTLPEGVQSIYGEMEVKWPDGTEDYLKNEPSIKPFVNKEGNLNQAALLKSYHETKKSFGKDKVILPNENSSDEEIAEFWGKLGAGKESGDYALNLPEEGNNINEDFAGKLQQFALDNKMPVETATKLAGFLNEQVGSHLQESGESQLANITEGLEKVKTEYGQAYDQKIGVAVKVLDQFVTDPETREMFDNPALGANPAVIKTLVNIGEKIFKEGNFAGETRENTAFSPEEAQEEINMIMGDSNHPFHNKNHPNHQAATTKMLKLYEYRG